MLFVLIAIAFGRSEFRWFGILVWLGMLLIQLFDHYVWDIWQGQLLWVFMVGQLLVFSERNLDKINMSLNKQ
jgi:hypothetical protein